MGADCRRVVFLCSGGGGNLCFFFYAINNGLLAGLNVVGVITDRPCQANAFATAAGIYNRVLDFSGDDQGSLLDELNALETDCIVTTVHKILRPTVVDRYRGRLVNLHYSLLPAFGGVIGTRPVRMALDRGLQFSGVTVHLVDETVDGGRPLAQAVIPLQAPEESFDELMNVVFRCGCIALAGAVSMHVCGVPRGAPSVLEIRGRPCVFGFEVKFADAVRSEVCWQAVSQQLAQAAADAAT